MPLNIRFRIIILLFLLSTYTIYAQSIDHRCLRSDKTGIIKRAFESFENDLFAYYKFGNDSIKTYRTFLAEVASLSIDLRKLPSSNSIALTRELKSAASNRNSLWVKLSDYENPEVENKPSSQSKSNEEEVITFNYRGGFIQCLKNSSNVDEFKEIITMLEEDGNISTSLTSQRIYYIPDKKFSSFEIKYFIALDIYYSILMIVEKAFK